MGGFISCPCSSRRNAVIDDQQEGTARGQDHQAGTENQDHAISRSYSKLRLFSLKRNNRCLLDARVFMVNQEYLVQMYEGSSYWVYAGFYGDVWQSQSFYAFDIKNQNCVAVPRYPVNALVYSATVVLDKKLYVIGGLTKGSVSNAVHMFDPISYNWFPVTPTFVPRLGALATTVGGKVYVFGGRSSSPGNGPWAEVYEPSTEVWTPIPHSQLLTDAFDSDLSQYVTGAVVFGNKIFIRGSREGIMFDTISSSWSPLSNHLMDHWGKSTAAVVKNMLVTCYVDVEPNQNHVFPFSIRAYDPQDDVWLTLEGLDESFHRNARRSHFMSINGMLVIYHMTEYYHDANCTAPWLREGLPHDNFTLSIIEMEERCETRVNVHLVWRCSFSIHDKWRLAIPAEPC